MSVKSTIQFPKRRYVRKDWLELGKKPILNESWQYKVQRVHLCGRRHAKPDDGPNHQPEQSFSLVPWGSSLLLRSDLARSLERHLAAWHLVCWRCAHWSASGCGSSYWKNTFWPRDSGLHVCLKSEHPAGSLPSSSYSRLLPGAQSIQIEKLEKNINSSHRRCNPQINKNKTIWSTAKFQLLKIIISKPNWIFSNIPGHIPVTPVTPTVSRRVAVAQWLAS